MSGNDWFRNKTWNSNIESVFFKKLGRARSQRDQYLAIQALVLAPVKPDITLRLVSMYFDSRKNDFHDYRVLIAKGKALEVQGDFAAAVETYKDLIAWQGARPSVKAGGDLMLAYLVATESLSEHFDFALEQLRRMPDADVFPVATFRRHAAAALIYSDKQESSLAQSHAVQALEAADIRHTGLRYHPKLGLVGPEYKKVVDALRRLATGSVPN